MTFKEIQELVKLINKSNITEFKVEKENFKLAIRTKKYGKARSQSSPAQQVVPIPTSAIPTVQSSYAAQPNPTTPSSAPVAAVENGDSDAATEERNYIKVKSPMVGTFYRSTSPDKPPYVKVGDQIAVGDVVCIVEAMKLFNEIESEVAGKIVKVMIEDAQPVEYDQVLYLVDPKG